MEKLLHIIATPRSQESRTLKVSAAFLAEIRKKYPRCQIDELNVFTESLPELTLETVDGKYILLSGKELAGEFKKAWRDIECHIKRFLLADTYLITAPMWNFSLPYRLKQYIDIVVQPSYLFKYTEKGPEGLAQGKKMVIITSRGGDYSKESPFSAYDFQEPYLRAIFGFVGITDITFINAQPMDALGPEIQRQKLEEAKLIARKITQSF